MTGSELEGAKGEGDAAHLMPQSPMKIGPVPLEARAALKALDLISEDQAVLDTGKLKQILDLLNYLCRNQTKFTTSLVDMKVPPLTVAAKGLLQDLDKKGKGKAGAGDDEDLSVPALDLMFALPCRQVAAEHTSIRRQMLDVRCLPMQCSAVQCDGSTPWGFKKP